MPKKEETKTVDTEVTVAADTALVKPGPHAIVPGSPEELAAYGVTPGQVAPGTEGIGKDDVKIPRLKVVQPMSKEANLESNAIVKGALYNTGTSDAYVEQGQRLPIIALACGLHRATFEERKVYWRSERNSNGMIHDPASPGGARPDGVTECAACPDGQWTGDDKRTPPECGIQYVYPVLALTDDLQELRDPGPMMFILAKTSVPAAKQINSVAKWSRLPLYAFIFDVWTQRFENSDGIYWVVNASRREKLAADDPRFGFARSVYNDLVTKDIHVELDGEDAEKEAAPF